MFTAAAASGRKARKGRTATVQPSTNMLISSVAGNSTGDARLQRLNAICGVTGPRAEVIAFLIWGEAQHG